MHTNRNHQTSSGTASSSSMQLGLVGHVGLRPSDLQEAWGSKVQQSAESNISKNIEEQEETVNSDKH